MTADPMSLVHDLSFVGDGGDHRPAAHRGEGRGRRPRSAAGIDVRMITGDHAVTARGDRRDARASGPGAISGAELQALSDEELTRRLPELHVFGRVTPQDKLRLARLMQEQGLIVAMTGDAVNDAAALKQADIGVAMGSGSEVTKQAARMILTDDNFGTLVHAVEIGRRVYDKVVAYVRYQMTQLLALVLLFLAATVFDINNGVAMTPLMVLYLLFFATAAGVVVIAIDPGDPDVMHRPPRDPALPITNRAAIAMWLLYAAVLFVAALIPLVAGPDEPREDAGVGVHDDDVRGDGLRHDLQRARQPARPGVRATLRRSCEAAAVSLVPAAMIVLATELPGLQRGLLTTSLTGREWMACLGLAALLPVTIEASKWYRRRGAAQQRPIDAQEAVSPGRARCRDADVTAAAPAGGAGAARPPPARSSAGCRGTSGAGCAATSPPGSPSRRSMVPKNLGYAGIAGIPLENGLYAAAAGALIYAVFCTSRQISTGPSSSLAAVAGGAVIVDRPRRATRRPSSSRRSRCSPGCCSWSSPCSAWAGSPSSSRRRS